MTRLCGDCQLCCKLVPVPPLNKKAGQKCKYQKFGKGCMVYNKPQMPHDCQLWNCRWLVNNDTGDLSRPDRSHYVIDVMPDYVTIVNEIDGIKVERHIEVVQVWLDPNFPDAHHDPALRAYLERRGAEGKIAIIRLDSIKAFCLIPPRLVDDHQWHEVWTDKAPEASHTPMQIMKALNKGG